MKKILLGLTTFHSDWRGKIKESSDLGIEETTLFLTELSEEERKKLYSLLEESFIKSVPHVHLRHDMSLSELEYLVGKFGTKVFNIHPQTSEYVFSAGSERYFPMTYVENVEIIPSGEDLNKYAGLCIDFSHWEDGILNNWPGYDKFEALVSKYKIGCAHISAVNVNKKQKFGQRFSCSNHEFNDLSEFDYIKKYKEYLPEIISLELTNSFKDQLKAKEYLEKIIL